MSTRRDSTHTLRIYTPASRVANRVDREAAGADKLVRPETVSGSARFENDADGVVADGGGRLYARHAAGTGSAEAAGAIRQRRQSVAAPPSRRTAHIMHGPAERSMQRELWFQQRCIGMA